VPSVPEQMKDPVFQCGGEKHALTKERMNPGDKDFHGIGLQHGTSGSCGWCVCK
jgi:hypothetical protein